MLHKLVFDTTSMADSANVGAYLRSADGTLLTHTDVGGKKALDVRIAEGINVEVDLTFAEDSVDASGSVVALDAATLAALESITVSATDLDIRDLAFATDKVDVSGSTVELGATTLAALESITVVDGGGSLTVDAIDLDIRNLLFATDKVDVSGSAVTVSSGSITVNDAALANTAIKATKSTLAVVDTAQAAVTSPLASRKYLYVYNNDNRVLYIGESGVAAAGGFPVPPGAMMDLRCGAAVAIQWVSNKLSHDMRTLELS